MSRRDPVTGLTEAELARLAEDAYEHRDDPDAWVDESPLEVDTDVRSVVSVRFSRGELGPIEEAAAAAGVPLSTFIRNAAINAVSTIDLDQARRAIQAMREQIDGLTNALDKDTPPQGRSSSKGKRVAAMRADGGGRPKRGRTG